MGASLAKYQPGYKPPEVKSTPVKPIVATQEDQASLNRLRAALPKSQPIAAPSLPNAVSAIGAKRAEFLQGQRDQTSRSNVAAQQAADDAITRRFASMGMSGSGAAMDAQLKARQGLAEQNQAAMTNLAGLEMGALEQDAAREMALADMKTKVDMYNQEAQGQDLARQIALEQLGFDRNDTEFNKWLAKLQANYQGGSSGGSGLLSQIFG